MLAGGFETHACTFNFGNMSAMGVFSDEHLQLFFGTQSSMYVRRVFSYRGSGQWLSSATPVLLCARRKTRPFAGWENGTSFFFEVDNAFFFFCQLINALKPDV